MAKLTEQQCRELFLEQVADIVTYWLRESRKESTAGKMFGLVHSILVLLDGESAALPAFTVQPRPHPTDREYCEENGEDWWPDDVDLAGSLHDQWHDHTRKNWKL